MRARNGVWNLDIADVDVGGDVHRIVLSGIKPQPGMSALAIRNRLAESYPELSNLLISYPYGHADMCADLVFKSAHPEADYGYVIMESMGYPYYSGSNTVATVAALLEYGFIPMQEGETEIRLEPPSGLISARYTIQDGRIDHVVVNGGAAYVISRECRADVPGFGPVDYALVWSGAYFLMVDAGSLNIPLTSGGVPTMRKAGRAICDAVARDFSYEHQQFGRIEAPKFVHFMGAFERTGDKRYEGRGATYGYPDTVFYCPTGTGTSARMALMHAAGQFEEDAVFENVSAMDNRFTGQALGAERAGRYEALATDIKARPFVLSTTRLHVDFSNPLMQAFMPLREIATEGDLPLP